MTEPKRFYLCDKKPGACKSNIEGCPNDMCFHTTNKKHALNKNGKFIPFKQADGQYQAWEVEV